MIVGVLRLDVVLYSPQSLKEKRGLVRKILERCRVRFPVSCAEVGLHDLWQRSEMGFSMVSGDEGTIQSVFTRIEEDVARTGFAEISERQIEIIHY